MNTAVSMALLVVGVILIGFGVDAYNAPASEISRFFNGAPTDRAIWLLVGGAVATVIGLVGVLKTR